MSNRIKRLASSPLRLLSVLLASSALLAPACSSDSPARPSETGGASSGQGGATGAGTTSTGGGGGTSSGGSNNGGAGTATGGGGAASGSGGSIGSGGSNNADAATAQDAALDTGVVRQGGSSARAVCAPGATYGNPLTGMGLVISINPPTTPPANYFAFIEGPVWIGSLGTLFFSDNVSPERIFKLVPPSTTPALFLQGSGSNGLAVDNDDKIVVADQAGQRITRIDPVTGQLLGVIVPMGNFKPNDVIVRSDGTIYFTDPDTGFYQVSPAGTLTGPFKQVMRPNGITLSLDENTLYVGDVGNGMITKFPVGAGGAVDVTRGSLFVRVMGSLADGMALDCAGNLYSSTQTGVEVYSPSAMLIGTIPTGEASNATFGGPDRKTLYVTSRSLLKAVTLNVPGLPD
jgi:gluconolactonase